MGLFASGVTIVTGFDGTEPLGFACQAFTSVSLDPPLILFCADHRGRTWPRIRKAGRFGINVLGEDQIDLCTRFASKSDKKFEGIDWQPSAWRTPALPDVLMRIHAETSDVQVVGDHDVVIGSVLGMELGVERDPLIFYRGRLGLDRDDESPSELFPLGLWGWADH
ncbi:flavin reductase family protein [Streptomyces acidicola]|uniref:flavin reductase family protein n=1 Tax=Streptomyces acidicola TaxID=2596892 RepID=UPI00381FEC82